MSIDLRKSYRIARIFSHVEEVVLSGAIYETRDFRRRRRSTGEAEETRARGHQRDSQKMDRSHKNDQTEEIFPPIHSICT